MFPEGTANYNSCVNYYSAQVKTYWSQPPTAYMPPPTSEPHGHSKMAPEPSWAIHPKSSPSHEKQTEPKRTDTKVQKGSQFPLITPEVTKTKDVDSKKAKSGHEDEKDLWGKGYSIYGSFETPTKPGDAPKSAPAHTHAAPDPIVRDITGADHRYSRYHDHKTVDEYSTHPDKGEK